MVERAGVGLGNDPGRIWTGKVGRSWDGALVLNLNVFYFLLCRNIKFNYCILDEGHVIKNGKTKLSKAIKQIAANFRVILSGTPIQVRTLSAPLVDVVAWQHHVKPCRVVPWDSKKKNVCSLLTSDGQNCFRSYKLVPHIPNGLFLPVQFNQAMIQPANNLAEKSFGIYWILTNEYILPIIVSDSCDIRTTPFQSEQTLVLVVRWDVIQHIFGHVSTKLISRTESVHFHVRLS